MAQYDPAKRYTWTPEDKFTLTGQQFGLILNTVRSYLSSEEAARFQLMVQTNQVIEELMIQGVEADIIKEVIEEAPIEEVSSKDL
jgi:CO dehydrogenase/acetyl-CoA synthase gamma subunit (corrinoid Fe-S protein)